MNTPYIGYTLDYKWRHMSSHGFSFDCDEHGNPLPFRNKETEDNYNRCISGKIDVVFLGVQKHEGICIS